MEHKGTEYSVVQSLDPKRWKWTVDLPGGKTKTGFSANRARAIGAAKTAIENAIKVRPEKQNTQ